jgi:hypothetical protein
MIPLAQIEITRNEAEGDFPETVTFHVEASSSSEIEGLELEFGTDRRACGESISRIVPADFQPGLRIAAEWTWDLRRTGALPPGTTVRWRWIVRDRSGAQVTTPDRQVTLEDPQHPWQDATAGPLRLNWYEGDSAFAQDLLAAGSAALASVRTSMGIPSPGELRVYVYATPESMQSATLFAPDWSGGLAFPDHRAVLLAVSPSQVDWGRRTIAHELTHVVVGQYTFSCLNSTPPWLDEGLAMFTEGHLDPGFADLLDRAVRTGTLLPVRSLGEVFSSDPDRARLAYAQSYSLVSHLIQFHGPENLVRLLDEFRQGASADRALESVYGFDLDGLDAAWRAEIGAPPSLSTAEAESLSTRTPYPTFVPLGGVNSFARTATPAPAGEQPPQAPAPALCGIPGAGVIGAAWVLAGGRRRAKGAP